MHERRVDHLLESPFHATSHRISVRLGLCAGRQPLASAGHLSVEMGAACGSVFLLVVGQSLVQPPLALLVQLLPHSRHLVLKLIHVPLVLRPLTLLTLCLDDC